MFSPNLAMADFDQVADGGGVVADKRLLVEANLFVELGQASLHDLVHHLLGLAFLQGARALDVALLVQGVGGDVFLADELRIGGGHLHGQVLHQLLEVVGARHEIRLAVHLHQHAQLRAGVNVAADDALPRGARGFAGGLGDARLAQDDLGFRQIALGFDQGLLALHHARAGPVAELLH